MKPGGLATAAAPAIFAFLATAVCAGAGSAETPGSIEVAGIKRTYVMNVPGKLVAPVPLVLSFHGHFSNGEQQARLTQFDALSDKYGFIVVYPDGIDGSWNDGRSQDAGADDVAFVRALIADVARRYPIDPKRIYATGFSNGGTFTQYLGCTLADRIAAIAPVSGYLPVQIAGACRPSRAISVLEIGGTADPIEPYGGGEVRIGLIDRGAVLSAESTAAFWRKNAGCSDSPVRSELAPVPTADGTSVALMTATACSAHASVTLYTVSGGGHTWPGGPQYLPAAFIGPASDQLDASQTIVDFFYAHPMP